MVEVKNETVHIKRIHAQSQQFETLQKGVKFVQSYK